jgi:hypothetical protein
MSFDRTRKIDLNNMTVKSLIELLDALAEVNENDSANDQNEFTISDNDGGTIELGISRGKYDKTITVRRKGLKLVLNVEPIEKTRTIRLIRQKKSSEKLSY